MGWDTSSLREMARVNVVLILRACVAMRTLKSNNYAASFNNVADAPVSWKVKKLNDCLPIPVVSEIEKFCLDSHLNILEPN